MFEVGQKVKTRDGRDARILAVDVQGVFPVIAAIKERYGAESVTTHLMDGHHYTGGVERCSDLMPPTPAPPAKTIWLNGYEGGTFAAIGSTQAWADDHAAWTPAKRICRIKVELTPGRFDE